ncbi:hypothetical protein HP499_17425 [Paenarthrobacter sp. CM16]|uniref:hypothetical protein n=1 Tax=Paenarthrobacter sp. CM16 TaxID=2738447 RepID=UPI00155457C8|nr:hypothetical protein [Paenarthrobacter sp. CM16]NQD89567.1 hypothetical protein [Paenarthrobacter sp. CM16]
MQDTHRIAKALVADNTITLDELWTQWWVNGGWAGQNDFGIYLGAPAWFDSFDLYVLAWALTDLGCGSPLDQTAGG